MKTHLTHSKSTITFLIVYDNIIVNIFNIIDVLYKKRPGGKALFVE